MTEVIKLCKEYAAAVENFYDRCRGYAQEEWASDECEIDVDAKVSTAPGENGAWVSAWVWVSFADTELDGEDEPTVSEVWGKLGFDYTPISATTANPLGGIPSALKPKRQVFTSHRPRQK